MSDLISRSALKDFIINAIDKQGGRGIDLLKVSEVIEVIENQHTAFDTEKVVEQLNNEAYTTTDTVCGGMFEAIRLSSAIDIVKKGGLE